MLLMSYNYAWLLSASYVDLSLTNAIFQVSVALVYVCSVRWFSEAVSIDRLLGVSLSLLGQARLRISVSLVEVHSWPVRASALEAAEYLLNICYYIYYIYIYAYIHDVSGGTAGSTILGTILALLAASGYTAYQVLFRWCFGHLKSNAAFLAHFGAWISIWHLLVILPMVWAAHILGIERLQWPAEPLLLLGTLLSAVLAFTVNALYLCIVMWASPMLLPSTSVLSVPLTLFLDVMLHEAEPQTAELFGQALVLLSVAAWPSASKRQKKDSEPRS